VITAQIKGGYSSSFAQDMSTGVRQCDLLLTMYGNVWVMGRYIEIWAIVDRKKEREKSDVLSLLFSTHGN
jgi:hypothetical protein